MKTFTLNFSAEKTNETDIDVSENIIRGIQEKTHTTKATKSA